MDHYASRYALPFYEDSFTEADDLNIRREVSRCQVFVEYRGSGLWCVTDSMNQNYGRDGVASHEPMPSNRRKEFLDQYRFTKQEALRVAAMALPEIVESLLHYARKAKNKAAEIGQPEFAAFHDRLIELVESGVCAVQAEFLGPAAVVASPFRSHD